MSETKPSPEPTCWDCGAANDPGASECWLCHRRHWQGPPRSPVPMKPELPPADHSSGLVGLALALVALGVVAIAPGFIFLLAILVPPAWFGAEFIAHRRRNRGLPTSATRKLVWIAALAVVMPILVGVALFITIWLLCLVSGPVNFH